MAGSAGRSLSPIFGFIIIALQRAKQAGARGEGVSGRGGGQGRRRELPSKPTFPTSTLGLNFRVKTNRLDLRKEEKER